MARNSTAVRLSRLLVIGITLITLATAGPFGRESGATTKSDATSREASASGIEYKPILEGFYDAVFNLPNLTEARNFIVPEYVDHNPVSPKSASGIEGLKHTSNVFRAAFPDLNVELEDLIVGEDRVAARIRMRGAHRGEFLGFQPTGKQIDIAAIEIYAFAGEKISERWGHLDGIALLEQLGVIPARNGPDDDITESGDEPSREGQQSEVIEASNLTDLNDWEKLKAAFMREVGRVRIVALVSPN